MARPLTLWIAIADGEHARFVQPDSNNAPRTLRAFDSTTAHLRSHDLGADRPGRSFESAASAHHAVGEKPDLHRLEKQRFAQLVAEQLNAAVANDEFDELLLIAPPRAMHELREALDDDARKRLIGLLEKDLVKTPDHELSPHIRQWVSPAHRPAV
jgi:protein required for attachment to host cells